MLRRSHQHQSRAGAAPASGVNWISVASVRALALYAAIGIAILPAHAADLDIDLRGLGRVTNTGAGPTVQLNQSGFNDLVRDIGLAFAPRNVGPAATIGSLGFAVLADASFTRVNSGADYWQSTVGSPSSVLSSVGLQVRKGLPFSVELGGAFSHLVSSSMYSVGADIKVAPLEGFRHLPDVALRTHIRAVLGANDLSVLTTGLDLLVSKGFGLGGVVELSPYVGYSLIYVYGTAQATAFFVDPAGEPGCDPSESTCARLGLFDDAAVFVHRGVFGLNLLAGYASLGFEVVYTEPAQTYTAHVGVDF